MISTPTPDDLRDIVQVLRKWQSDDLPFQLHPGDIGWYWRFGSEATAQSIRIWKRVDRILAVGLLDGPGLLRLAIRPELHQDEPFSQLLADNVTQPMRGDLPDTIASIETPADAEIQRVLIARDWQRGETWTHLRRFLDDPIPDSGLRIEVVQATSLDDRVAVQRASFENSTFTRERWLSMASGDPYKDARCLVAYDKEKGAAVAAVTVWSAGVGKPGLIEPLGVHREHRSRGHGKGITLAALAALKQLGASSAIVATPTTNAGAVATYRSAGFQTESESYDLIRPV